MTAPEQMRACPTPWCSHDCTPYTWQGPSDHYTVICEECQVEGPYCATEAEAITAWNTRPAPAELVEALPDDISELVLRIGRAEWGQTPAHDAEGHAAHVADSVRITAEHFGQDGPQHMHGLYVAGTETVICHSGTSPNSPQIARALTGAWNRLHDLAALRNAGAAL